MLEPNTLYIVPTPIGNLSDISQRALDTLQKANLIACEDTRHTARLLNHYDINAKTTSLHDHNETQRTQWLLEKLSQGQSIALVSDAGTPLISDPGYVLVKTCRQAGINVIALPGPCALTTALSASGLPTDSFSFFGFLPVKQQAKAETLQRSVRKGHTSVFYEAPRRIKDTLSVCVSCFDFEHEVVLAKELSKTFETYVSGTAQDVLDWLEADSVHEKGEFVLMIYALPANSEEAFSEEVISLLALLKSELPLKKAAAIVAQHYSVKKNALYKFGLAHFD